MNSEIIPFYSNANILVTGGTGLFGKMIVQKVLRTCDISGFYLIIREKKGKSSSERLQELFDDPIFGKLKEKNPQFQEKIHIVEGDCSRLGLGLDQSSRRLLIDKINIVFHCAAELNMDAKMKDAVATNVRGLSELLDLCHEMRHLKSMVFVSTAYSNCTQRIIEEKFYNPPIQAATLVKLADELHEKVLDKITPGLISSWPNTYCFTKAIAENMFEEKAKGLPAGLFRPSIVMPTCFDPIPGWTSNIYGPVGVMLASGMGLLRVFYCDPDNKFDFVPVDLCINGLLCSAWEIHQKALPDTNNEQNAEMTQLPVYNYSGGIKRNSTWYKLMDYAKDYEYPLKQAIWATYLILTGNTFYYNFLWFFLHLVPAYIFDFFLLIRGQKPKLVKAYKKISKFSQVLAFFTKNEWDIVNDNVYKLWNTLNDTDKDLFPFNMDVLNIKEYIQNTCLGIKLYVLKEPLDNATQEKKHYQRLVMLHNAVRYGIFFILLLCCYKVLKFSSQVTYSLFT